MEIKRHIYGILKRLGASKVKSLITQTEARYFLKKHKNKSGRAANIRIAFVVYEPAMWDKQEVVYNEMNKRSEIFANLVVVPDLSASEKERKLKEKFFTQKYQNVLIYNDSVAKKFAEGYFHYTFYQTPYCFKYPTRIKPHRLVRYTKICYIPYGYVGSSDFFDVTSNVEFFENVYFGFMDSEPMCDLLQRKFSDMCSMGYQHFCCLGYPSLEFYINMKKNASDISEVLWIPRWSYAEKGGGSHFLEYKDEYTKTAVNFPDIHWTMRPHPLMFSALNKSGCFSHDDLVMYKHELSTAKITLDEQSLLNDTLEKTDLLIADYSSIIIMYLLSGRPVIYCDCNIEFSGAYTNLREIMYIARNWEEVLMYVQNVVNGIDPLKQKREEFAAEEGKKHINSSKRIVDRIIEDYYS